jgi:hypothetical protein
MAMEVKSSVAELERILVIVAPAPAIKPFRDTTGPENVVRAMIFPHMRIKAFLSACRQPGLSETPGTPECFKYTPKSKK